MLGLLFFISTLALVPHASYFLPLVYYLFINRKNLNLTSFSLRKIDRNFLFISIIVFFCFINRLLFVQSNDTVLDLVPYTVLMLLSYFYSQIIEKKDLTILVWLIVVEGLVVVVEYLVGINTFIPQLDYVNDSIRQHPGQFYFHRPLGLSTNSSIVACKVLLAFVLLDVLRLSSLKYQLVRLFLLIVIFLTFNRTVFVVVLFYIALQSLKPFFIVAIDLMYRKVKRKYVFHLVIGLGVIFVTTYFISTHLESVVFQLTRNKGIDLAGRDEIWVQFIDFIKTHLWFGNGSEKYYADYYSGPIHAHNSFLQLIANNGLLISLLFFTLIFINITKKNWIYIFILFVYSTFQYGIFWGISLTDILFFFFLFNSKKVTSFYDENELITQKEIKD